MNVPSFLMHHDGFSNTIASMRLTLLLLQYVAISVSVSPSSCETLSGPQSLSLATIGMTAYSHSQDFLNTLSLL